MSMYRLVNLERGPLATVRTCAVCGKFSQVFRRGRGSWGDVAKHNGEVLAHIKEAHPAEYAAELEAHRAVQAHNKERKAQFRASLGTA